jgi:hypothetical protein
MLHLCISITRSNKEKNKAKKEMNFYKDLMKVVIKRNPSEADKEIVRKLFWTIDINNYDVSRADRNNYYNLRNIASGI